MSLRFSAALFFAVWFALSAAPAWAGQAADEILAAVQSHLKAGRPLDEIEENLKDLPDAELEVLVKNIDRAWPSFRDRYLSALKSSARPRGAAGNKSKSRIRKLRADFNRVKNLPEGAMKPPLHSISKPALDELRSLLSPTAADLATAGGMATEKLRESARALAKFRDKVLSAALSATPSDTVKQLDAEEQNIARKASGLDRDGLRILEKNRKIAKNADIPPEIAEGIEECNMWRLYTGRNALVIDPKLCEAAHGHSQDMAERNFFAHVSPVPGKTQFTDRARRAGTTASGENIYMGSTDPHAANEGWFFSPGHHKNMFNEGHRRIGLGRFNRHWTQMFGR
jgi:uncharacterized protein YkwD